VGVPEHFGDDDALLAAELSPTGQQQLFSMGRARFEAELAGLSGAADRDVSWLFAEQAELSAASAEQLWQRTALEGLPGLLGKTRRAEAVECLLWVPEDLSWFKGHFPGQPILPAVVQLSWAVHFAGLPPDVAQAFSHLHRLKFTATIEPSVVLKLTLISSDESVQFCFESRQQLHSKGRIDFRGGAGQSDA